MSDQKPRLTVGRLIEMLKRLPEDTPVLEVSECYPPDGGVDVLHADGRTERRVRTTIVIERKTTIPGKPELL